MLAPKNGRAILVKEVLGKIISRTDKEAARAWTQTDVSYLSFEFSARVSAKQFVFPISGGPQGQGPQRGLRGHSELPS